MTVALRSDPGTQAWRGGGLTFELRETTLRARHNEAEGFGSRSRPLPFGEYALFEDGGRLVTVAVTGAARPEARTPIPLVDPFAEATPDASEIIYACSRTDVDEWISLLFTFDRPSLEGLTHFDGAWLSSALVVDGREFLETPGYACVVDQRGGTIFNVPPEVDVGESALVRVVNSRTGQQRWFLVDMRGVE